MKKASLLLSSTLALSLFAAPIYAAEPEIDAEIAAMKAQIAKLTKAMANLEARQQTLAHGKKKGKSAPVATSATAEEPVAGQAAPVTDAPATGGVTASAAPGASTTAAATPEAQKADEPVTKGSFPGSFKIPGLGTSVKIGGYIKLDAIADLGTGYGAPYARFYALPLANSAAAHQGAQTSFSAQQSRINLETRTPTALGELKTFVEGDFYGASAANANTSGYGFELRHAYGSLGPILAGQTWSNFMDVNAMPESLDYIGPAGNIFVRQAQVRYTHAFDQLTVSASLEAPLGNQTSAFTTQNGVTFVSPATGTARGKMPDIVARADYQYAKSGYVSVRGLVNQINIDRTVGTSSLTDSKYGYGVALSGKQTVLEKDAVVYDLFYGDGTGRYIYDVGSTSNYYKDGHLTTQEFFGGTLGYQHAWSEHFRSNIFGGFVRVLNETSVTGPDVNREVASGHVNLIWQPVPSYKVGMEYMHGFRRQQSGVEGNLDRLQASFIYNF